MAHGNKIKSHSYEHSFMPPNLIFYMYYNHVYFIKVNLFVDVKYDLTYLSFFLNSTHIEVIFLVNLKCMTFSTDVQFEK